jgi:ethanolamine kinase
MDPLARTEKLAQVIIDTTNKQKSDLVDEIRSVAKHCLESWESIPLNEIVVKDVTGGMTNYLFSASVPESKRATCEPSIVLVRIYGYQTDLIIDRQRELVNIGKCYKTGFGPKLYGTFKNGYIYEYFFGKPISPEELEKCTWNARLGTQLAKWHKQTQVSTEKEPEVWTTIESWLSLVPENYPNEAQNKKWHEIGGMTKLRKELSVLKDMAHKSGSPIVFAHNDLLGGNIIVNEETGAIKFIDFEYASTNYQAFDIANHFNEFAGFEADYSRYPQKEKQYEFYRTYLKEYNGVEPSEQDLERLYVQVNQFALLSHFYWGSWALVQGAISKIEFDFVTYAGQRFTEYLNRKHEFLSLKLPSS